LAQLLQLPWQSAQLLTLAESVTVQVSKKGKALVKTSSVSTSQQQQVHNGSSAGAGSSGSNGNSQSMPQQQQQQQVLQVPELFGSAQQEQQQQQVLINLQHDRVKATPINGNAPDPFLHKIGLQTAEGRIKANMQVGGSEPAQAARQEVPWGASCDALCDAAAPTIPCRSFCVVTWTVEALSTDVEGAVERAFIAVGELSRVETSYVQQQGDCDRGLGPNSVRACCYTGLLSGDHLRS